MSEIVKLIELKPAQVNRFGEQNTNCVLRSEYKPNCFIYQSFGRRRNDFAFEDINVSATVSFIYDHNGEIATEWEPCYGPIQIWTACEADHKDARSHWHFPTVVNNWGNWSQIAVEREGLKQFLIDSDFDAIFAVLRAWAISRVSGVANV